MRIATWNVNSLRSRIDRVEALLERHEIDVLALQETKAREDQLPLMGLQSLGLRDRRRRHNQWNGVAILSRVGLEDVADRLRRDARAGASPVAAESRAIGATCGGVRIWSLYVPNGRKLDDPHYVYKLDWLAPAPRGRPATGSATRPALVGDWNVAPQDDDVFDMAAVRQELDPRHPGRSGRRSRPSSTTATSTSYAQHVRRRTSTPTGTTTGSASSATAACASTSCSVSPSLAARVTGAFIDRDERAAGHRRRPTTRR